MALLAPVPLPPCTWIKGLYQILLDFSYVGLGTIGQPWLPSYAAWRQAYMLYSLRVLFFFFVTLGRWCLLTDADMFQLLSHCSSIFRSYLQIYGVSNWEQILLLYRMISANSLVKHFGQFAKYWCASHWCWWGTGSRQRESPSFIH